MRNIVIIGGGSAGWMTAAMLSHQLRPERTQITVVDDNAGGIGVGEATIPSIMRLLKTLRVDESEFMRACSATWKLGIQFCDWVRAGHTNWHPFGVCGARLDGRDLFPYWLATQGTEAANGSPDSNRPYHSYSLHWAASLAGKCPHSTSGKSPISETGSYGFHLDAGQFSEWLKKKAFAAGVRHVVSQMQTVEMDDTGNVAAIRTTENLRLSGDLFIDCTGFRAELLQQASLSQWVSWNDQLLCDRAVTMRRPNNGIIPPYTTATALSSGWVWDIALARQRGIGYVYSSRFLTDEAAKTEMVSRVGVSGDHDVEVRFLNMNIGRQRFAWQKNVVAIGLSAGFVEPLESSGLHLIQVGIERLIKCLTPDSIQPALRMLYNDRMSRVFDEVRDFIQLHYLLNQRPEPFWQAARSVPVGDELQHRLDLFDATGLLPNLRPEAFPDGSYYHLLAGCGRLPQRVPVFAANADLQSVEFAKRSIVEQNRNVLRRLPLHEEGLKQIHTLELAKAS